MPTPSTPPRPSVREVVDSLVAEEGSSRVVAVCAALLDGARSGEELP